MNLSNYSYLMIIISMQLLWYQVFLTQIVYNFVVEKKTERKLHLNGWEKSY